MNRLVIVVLWFFCVECFAEQVLNLKHYLDLHLKQNHRLTALLIQQPSQSLALQIGREYWKPSVSAVAAVEEQRSSSLADQMSFHQFSAGIESQWVSDIGTQVTLNISQLNGEGLGKEVLFKQQSAQKLTATITQPLLKHNRVRYQHIEQRLAENQWLQFINSQNQVKLNVYRDALSGFLDYQIAYENWALQSALLTSIKKTEMLVEKMYEVEKATLYERQQARLQRLTQEAEVNSAFSQLAVSQSAAYLEVRSNETLLLQPFSLTEFICLMIDSASVPLRLDEHPDYLALRLMYESSSLAYQKEEDALKANLDVFYQIQKTHYQTSMNEKEEVFGLRFSYLLTNKSVQLQRSSLKAKVESAELEQQLALHKMTVLYDGYVKNSQSLAKQVGALANQVELAKTGLEQQRRRYQVGKASYFSLEEVQKELIDQQIEWLGKQKNLIESLILVSYYTQFDIRNAL
jgi:outer membrane protein TolC